MTHLDLAGYGAPELLRECRPCQAIRTYEQPFRLSCLQARDRDEVAEQAERLAHHRGLALDEVSEPG